MIWPRRFHSGGLETVRCNFFPENFARTMAMNMLNLEPDEINPVIVEDCLKESANMICGNFLRKFDADWVFDLGLPQLSKNRADSDGTGFRLFDCSGF